MCYKVLEPDSMLLEILLPLVVNLITPEEGRSVENQHGHRLRCFLADCDCFDTLLPGHTWCENNQPHRTFMEPQHQSLSKTSRFALTLLLNLFDLHETSIHAPSVHPQHLFDNKALSYYFPKVRPNQEARGDRCYNGSQSHGSDLDVRVYKMTTERGSCPGSTWASCRV